LSPGAAPSHRYVLADVFTDRIFAGNPLAVFPDGGAVPPELMGRIAGELNLSETAFVLPPDDPAHTARLRIFAPGKELPFAGHPTIGTACVLAALGRVPLEEGEGDLVLEEGVGPVPVWVSRRGGTYFARLQAPKLPEFGPEAPSLDTLARLVSISPEELGPAGWSPAAVSCGVPFLVLPVRDGDVLARVRPNGSVWDDVLGEYWARQVYVITAGEDPDGSTVRARMFAPGLGVPEDPATGAAAAALAGYLAARAEQAAGTFRWQILQGVEMGRPSRIEAEAEKQDGRVTAVRVGGECVVMGEGRLRIGGAT
jgi:trans-2,3-dihydro-3-hydroxyanthranilate isomerase